MSYLVLCALVWHCCVWSITNIPVKTAPLFLLVNSACIRQSPAGNLHIVSLYFLTSLISPCMEPQPSPLVGYFFTLQVSGLCGSVCQLAPYGPFLALVQHQVIQLMWSLKLPAQGKFTGVTQEMTWHYANMVQIILNPSRKRLSTKQTWKPPLLRRI